MSNRIIKDIIDPESGKKIYFKNHAKATFMSDGSTVEDAVIMGLSEKQDTLVSGTNIKTINGTPILGSGDIEISSNPGTITEVKANGTSIATSGVADIPAATTAVYGVTKLSSSTTSSSRIMAATPYAVKYVRDLVDGKQDALVSGTNIKTINGTTILGSGDITISGGGSSLTESDIAGMGFTKNQGTITGVSANGTSVATSGVANIPAASTSAYGVTKLSSSTSSTSTTLAATPSAVKAAYDLANGKQDKLVSGTSIKTINGTSILGSGDITISGGSGSGSGTITGVSVNGTSIATSGVANIPAASASATGVVTTTEQQFAGKKIFTNGIKIGSATSDYGTDKTKIYFGDGSYVWIGEAPDDDSLTINVGSSDKIYFSFQGNSSSSTPTTYVSSDGFYHNDTLISGGSGTITGVSANGTSVATSGVADIPAASTSAYGVTKLSSATNSPSTSLAATASAVKAAYDLAAKVTDVTANGTSVVASGVANIPAATTSVYGVTKLGTSSVTAAAGNHSHNSLNLIHLGIGNSSTQYLTIHTATATAPYTDKPLYMKIEDLSAAKKIRFSPYSDFREASYTIPQHYCLEGGANVIMYLGGTTQANSTGKLYGGTVTATTISQTSDETLKDFKGDIEVDLDKLAQLSKKYFTWKDSDIDNDTHIGTSAQEIQKLYPEIVHDRGDGVLTLEYDKLSIIALKGIDVLYEKIKTIEKRLNKLENI